MPATERNIFVGYLLPLLITGKNILAVPITHLFAHKCIYTNIFFGNKKIIDEKYKVNIEII